MSKWLEDYAKAHDLYGIHKQELRIKKLERIMEEKKYTISEIKKYLEKQDSMGDILYNLNEANLDKAQEGIKILDVMNGTLFLNIQIDAVLDDDDIRDEIVKHMENNGMEIGFADIMKLEDLLLDLGCYIPDYEF